MYGKFIFLGCFFISWSMSAQSVVNLGSTEIKSILSAHNKERSLVGSPNLIWNSVLADHAQEWAVKLAEDDNGLVHRPSGDDSYGENIAFFSGHTFDAAYPVELWNEEKSDYRYAPISYSNFSSIGHYTQVIWKNTTQVGCGCAKSERGAYFFVCNYDPAGNFIGQYPYK